MEKTKEKLINEQLKLKLDREREHRRYLEDQYEKNKFILQSTKEEIEKLVFQVTHDLRGPISSFGQLVEDVLPQLPRDRQNLFLSSIARIQDICNDVLKRHKMGDSMTSVRKTKKAVDIVSLTNLIVEEKKVHFKDSQKISFEINCNGLQQGKEYANIKEGELTCILFNTIENSIEAIQEKNKKGLIRIELSKLERDYKLVIEDTGVGVPQKQIKDIGKYGITFKKTGNGLGLYSSIHYLQKRGGTLKIFSQLGEGTSVVMTIPLGATNNEKIKVAPNSLVVIVDDDVLVHENIRLFLDQSRFEGEVLNFYTEEEFRSWHGVFESEPQQHEQTILYIIDGFIQSSYPNGPKVIKDLGIADNAIIYTGKRSLISPTDTRPGSLRIFDKGVPISEILIV